MIPLPKNLVLISFAFQKSLPFYLSLTIYKIVVSFPQLTLTLSLSFSLAPATAIQTSNLGQATSIARLGLVRSLIILSYTSPIKVSKGSLSLSLRLVLSFVDRILVKRRLFVVFGLESVSFNVFLFPIYDFCAVEG
jgi:hypothetical protein